MKNALLILGTVLCSPLAIAEARYYLPTAGRFISPDIIVEELNDPQSLNRYAYVRNNPLVYSDPMGFWRMKVSLHMVFGGHLTYDSKTDNFGGGVGVGKGGGVSVGDDNWEVGYSNDNYFDAGYDGQADSLYAEGRFGDGVTRSNGVAHGYGGYGNYYVREQDFSVGAGAGYSGFGINGGYSSFGKGGWNVGGSAWQTNGTYDFGAKKWSYSYTVNPKDLSNAFEEERGKRQQNGYGPRGSEKYFKQIDWLGTVTAGSTPSERHDLAYRKGTPSKAAADLRLLTDMVRGSAANTFRPNGFLRAAVGLVVSPFYYGAVVLGGRYEPDGLQTDGR